MNDKSAKPKAQRQIKQSSVLESIKDVGVSTAKTVKKDLLQGTSKDFIQQLLGNYPTKRASGEVFPGESLEFDEVLNGKHAENIKLKRQVQLERGLRQEEEQRSNKKANELKLQLNAIMQEIEALAETTQELGDEVKIAIMQAPIEPGVYHIVFFTKMLEFAKSFRKKINEAVVWLHAANKRAEKKNVWGQRYKKHGAKFLLSSEHYLTRSAG